MKTEPDEFSINDLQRAGSTLWTGVRNYQARNFMTQKMRHDDHVFVYHSSCETPGIYGLGQVLETPVVDPTQFDKKSDYFDPKSPRDNPRWHCAKIGFVEVWPAPLTLARIRQEKSLQTMALLKRGQRLSIQLVTPAEARLLLKLRSKGDLDLHV
jgi:predicted RNA-binding protein with PUA-like domain